MIFDKDKFNEFKKETENEGIKVTKIGEVVKENKTVVVFNDKTLTLSEPGSDELYKIID